MTLFDAHDPRPVHFVGIAGAGMSALAELFARRGIARHRLRCQPRQRTTRSTQLGIAVEPRPRSVARRRRAVRRRDLRDAEGSPRARARARARHPRDSSRRGARRARWSREDDLHRRHARQDDDDRHDDRGARRRRDESDGHRRRPRRRVGRESAAAAATICSSSRRTSTTARFSRSRRPSPSITNVEADHLDIYADLDDIRGAFAQFASRARASCSAPTMPARRRLRARSRPR